ncbi:DUF2567 domain-containing protein [Saccharopolyspora sp. CA-218241]|uniref:DUF2567 domain-containing protein n=1 Tax=Saccharopolyspora sp. CA-218241 TaxID=3240027 RepID=UPI003D96AACD
MTESAGHGAAVPAGPHEEPFEGPWLLEPVPKVVVKADLLPAVSTASLIALLGIPLGWLWSLLAPAQAGVLLADGTLASMPLASYHAFDALALFLLLGFTAGVLVAAVLWMSRRRRGPVLLLAGVVGAALSGWLAMTLGASFAAAAHPVPPTAAPGDLIQEAPAIGTAWALLAQPFGLTLGYGLCASWNGLDDLGRRGA